MQISARAIVDRAADRKAMYLKAERERRTRVASVVSSADQTVRRIADDMIDIAAAKGAAEEEDLLNRGWTIAALRAHGTAARELANHAVVRRS